VRWRNSVPSAAGPYTFRLSNVAGRYSCMLPENTVKVYAPEGDPEQEVESTDHRIVHTFPRSCNTEKVSHRNDVSVYNNELYTYFRTLRYRDDDIPSIQVFNGTQAVTPLIDLTDFFLQMGWICDRNIEQVYSILLEIGEGGTTTVWPGKVTTSDWIEGGIVS